MIEFIYELYSKRTGIPFYVGRTNNPNTRLYQHLKDTDITPKAEAIRTMLADGDEPAMRIIETIYDGTAQLREIYWIQTYQAQGVDLTNGYLSGNYKSRAKASRCGSIFSSHNPSEIEVEQHWKKYLEKIQNSEYNMEIELELFVLSF